MEHNYTFCALTSTIRNKPDNLVIATRKNRNWTCDSSPEVPYPIAKKVFQTLYRQHSLRWGTGEKLLEALNLPELVDFDKSCSSGTQCKELKHNEYTDTLRFSEGNYMAATNSNGHWVCDFDPAIPEECLLPIFSTLHNKPELRYVSGESLVKEISLHKVQREI